MPMTNEQRSAYIASLIEERNAQEQRGNTDRVKDIDAELRAVGHDAKTPSARAEKRPRQRKAETR